MKANIVLDYINAHLQGNTEALNALKQYALEELQIKNSKSPDSTKARIAYAKKRSNDKKEVRPGLKGAFINDGKMILSDGFMALRFEPIDNIATVPEDVPTLQTLGKLIDNASQNYGDTVVISKSTLITTLDTTLSEMKAYKARAKYEGRKCDFLPSLTKIGNDYPVFVDTEILKDIVKITEPDNNDNIVIVTSVRTNGTVYVKGNDCDGIICPVHPTATENYPLNIPNIA